MVDRAGPVHSDELKFAAMYVASVIRNAMEEFHVQHLSDEQMKELNPIIRNAVYTALHALEHSGDSEQSKRFMDANKRLIPPYWEAPEFLAHYTKIWETKFPKV